MFHLTCSVYSQMDIKLRGQEVILDEAHNIEDAAREAASRSVTQEDIRRAKLDMDNLSKLAILTMYVDVHKHTHTYIYVCV